MLPHYQPTFHITNFDRTKKGKKKTILLLFCGLKKGVNIVTCEMLWHVLVGLRVEGRFSRRL
jgi:hypothetical protein